MLKHFEQNSDWTLLINKRSTTFRNLPEEVKARLKDDIDKELAFSTVLAQPTLLKRPLLIHKEQVYLGFKAPQYHDIFATEQD